MSGRLLLSISALAALLAASLPGQTSKVAAGSFGKTKGGDIPRDPDGHPDLQGIWSNATITPMERSPKYASKPTLSDAEAKVLEESAAQELQDSKGKSESLPVGVAVAGAKRTGGFNFGAVFIDRGSELARVDGKKRTSLIIDPPDGKLPARTPESQERLAASTRNSAFYDNVKNRPVSERCLVGIDSTSGPPMMPVLYNNNYQIVQTKNAVMILVEMVHDVRIIRINGTHPPQQVREWLGDSIGRWEGDTLVVDTTNFNGHAMFSGTSENLHVIERFRRVDPSTILYKVTIDDPATFSKSWTMEFPFLATPGPIYEYACHEGNYAMTDILSGASKPDSRKK